MITEIAQIEVKPGLEDEFEAGVRKAREHFAKAKGFHGMGLVALDREAAAVSAAGAVGDTGESHGGFLRL